MGYVKKLLAIALAFGFLFCIPNAARGAYRLSLTGAVDFQAEPWTPTNFTGYIVVGLGAESQSQLDVTVAASGEVAQWLTWTDPDTFTLFPAQQIFVHYLIQFPAMPPEEYTGQIAAIGVPTPGTQIGDAAVPGNVALAVGVSIMVPSLIYLRDVYADGIGGAATVANYLNYTFNGNVTFNLTQSASWIETHVVNVTNMTHNSTLLTAALWNNAPLLGMTYTVNFHLRDMNGTLIDEAALNFRLPTPADIISIWHRPNIVYEDYDAEIYATVHDSQNGATECTCHYIIDGGAEQTGQMDYDDGPETYRLLIDNTSYQAGSIVEYWVTSENNATGTLYTGVSEHRTFRVYSNTAPDLAIDADSFQFIPINPTNETMYDTNTTNIFVAVNNLGRGDSTDVLVRMIDNHNGTNVSTQNFNIASITGLNFGTASFVWDSPAAGVHNLRFIADPNDNITEINENNNYYSLDITVTPTDVEEPGPEDNIWDMVPYIVIPLIILLLLLLLILLMRRGNIKVMILETKQYTSTKDGSTKWRYVCGFDVDRIFGTTASTEILANEYETILVRPKGLSHNEDDGSLTWTEAKVVKALPGEEPDTEERLRSLAKVVRQVK